LLVWVVPYIGLLAGLVLVVFVVTRWNRRPQQSASAETRPVVDDVTRQRIRREVAELDRE
jgi:cytochrome c-type biogenesis protein CcmH/NrfF